MLDIISQRNNIYVRFLKMTRAKIPDHNRTLVLLEAGYKCANPVCRHILTLELHHIVWVKDGGTNNPENLLILTHKSHRYIHVGYPQKIKCKNCGKKTTNKKYCSPKCYRISSRKVNRPSKKQLEKDIKTMTWVSIGRKYGVSDNAIRKWAKQYNIVTS